MVTTPVTAYLSLGSNMGDRLENLRLACRSLEECAIRLRHVSSIYETEPVDFAEQDWFLNCVAEIETELPPLALLDRLQEIECQLGRRRERPNGPRTIDIDILLYGDCACQSERLLLPHPRMLQRRFVLDPLREIAPGLRFPLSNKTVEELFQELRDPSQVRLSTAYAFTAPGVLCTLLPPNGLSEPSDSRPGAVKACAAPETSGKRARATKAGRSPLRGFKP